MKKIIHITVLILLYSCSSVNNKFRIENVQLRDSISNLLYIPTKDSIKPLITNNYSSNVLYRGMYNHIHIDIPNTKRIHISGVEFKNKDGVGNYVVNATTVKGTKILITINATFIDGTQQRYIEEFKIKDLPRPITSINTMGEKTQIRLKKEEFKDAVINAYFPNFTFDEFIIEHFYIDIPNESFISNHGSKINTRILKKIQRLNKGDIVKLYRFKYDFVKPIDKSIHLKRLPPIFIEIIE